MPRNRWGWQMIDVMDAHQLLSSVMCISNNSARPVHFLLICPVSWRPARSFTSCCTCTCPCPPVHVTPVFKGVYSLLQFHSQYSAVISMDLIYYDCRFWSSLTWIKNKVITTMMIGPFDDHAYCAQSTFTPLAKAVRLFNASLHILNLLY